MTEKERNIPTTNPQGLNDNGVKENVGRNRSVFMVDLCRRSEHWPVQNKSTSIQNSVCF